MLFGLQRVCRLEIANAPAGVAHYSYQFHAQSVAKAQGSPAFEGGLANQQVR